MPRRPLGRGIWVGGRVPCGPALSCLWSSPRGCGSIAPLCCWSVGTVAYYHRRQTISGVTAVYRAPPCAPHLAAAAIPRASCLRITARLYSSYHLLRPDFSSVLTSALLQVTLWTDWKQAAAGVNSAPDKEPENGKGPQQSGILSSPALYSQCPVFTCSSVRLGMRNRILLRVEFQETSKRKWWVQSNVLLLKLLA